MVSKISYVLDPASRPGIWLRLQVAACQVRQVLAGGAVDQENGR